jgi:CheY-like chemotaxis protein
MECTKTILLVEDNAGDAELARRALEMHGAADKLVVASDGVEALDYLFGTGAYEGRDMSVTASLILLDLKLPRMDGLEVLRRLHEDSRTALIPVVVLTSSDREADLTESYQLGCNSYLRKPDTFAGLLQAMGQLVSYWLLLNEPPPDFDERPYPNLERTEGFVEPIIPKVMRAS